MSRKIQILEVWMVNNKLDSPERIINREQGEKLASSLGMKYFEISCKINMNIPEVMSRMIMESYMKTNHIENCFRIIKNDNQNQIKQVKKGCC